MEPAVQGLVGAAVVQGDDGGAARIACERYRLPADTIQLRLEPARVHARAADLEIIFGNLLDNALKYSPSTSTMEIRAQGNGAVDVVVHNSGSTISEREQARGVERFYRGAQARHIPGTGMGLAIVQQIARAHGGTLTISSSPDAGTAFTLSLPREGRAL